MYQISRNDVHIRFLIRLYIWFLKTNLCFICFLNETKDLKDFVLVYNCTEKSRVLFSFSRSYHNRNVDKYSFLYDLRILLNIQLKFQDSFNKWKSDRLNWFFKSEDKYIREWLNKLRRHNRQLLSLLLIHRIEHVHAILRNKDLFHMFSLWSSFLCHTCTKMFKFLAYCRESDD